MQQAESVEVKGEKVFIPPSMMPKEIREKYGLNHTSAYRAKKKVSS